MNPPPKGGGVSLGRIVHGRSVVDLWWICGGSSMAADPMASAFILGGRRWQVHSWWKKRMHCRWRWMCFNADGSGSSMVADSMASAFLVVWWKKRMHCMWRWMCFNADGSGSSMVADPMASAFLVEEEDALQMKLDMIQCRCGCTIAILAAVETFGWKMRLACAV